MNALTAQQRATDLEVVVKQKDNEVDALRTAMNESELTAKQAIDSMMVCAIYFLWSNNPFLSAEITGKTPSRF